MLPKDLTEVWERITGIIPEYLDENVDDYEDAEWVLDNDVFGETYILKAHIMVCFDKVFRKGATISPTKIFPYSMKFDASDEISVSIYYRKAGKFWSNGKYHTAEEGFYVYDNVNENMYLKASLDAIEIAAILSPEETDKWIEATYNSKEPKWGYLSILSKQFDI